MLICPLWLLTSTKVDFFTCASGLLLAVAWLFCAAKKVDLLSFLVSVVVVEFSFTTDCSSETLASVEAVVASFLDEEDEVVWFIGAVWVTSFVWSSAKEWVSCLLSSTVGSSVEVLQVHQQKFAVN